jgi:predicted dithiol-disulfide oxidoreductase (DUF899 family)
VRLPPADELLAVQGQHEAFEDTIAVVDLVVYHFMFGPGYTAGCRPVRRRPTASTACSRTSRPAADVTMICISRAPLEKLLAHRRRMGWSFNRASSYGSDFNSDFGVSAEDGPHDAAPLLEANEVAARPLLRDQAVSDSLPPVAKYNADATGTDAVGYFA